MVEVRFVTEELAFKNSSPTPKRKEGILLPTHEGRRIVRIRIGQIPLEIKGWLVMAVLLEIMEDITIIQAMRTHKLNWSGYGFEQIIEITEKNLNSEVTRQHKVDSDDRG